MAEKYLITLDGSEYSKDVIQYGVNLAEKVGAEVVVLHVVEPFSKKTTVLAQFKEEMVEQTNNLLKLFGEEAIANAKAAIADYKGPVKYVTKIGYPADEIINTAKEENCSLIIIGSRGRNAVGQFFLGSVSSKVSMHAHIPVLIVKK